MSKRNSVGTPNTLFKYFNKSPSVSNKSSPVIKTEKSSPTKRLKEETPKARKSIKRDLEKSKESDGNDNSDEEIKVSRKKRRRILAVDSDSDRENDSDSQNVTKTQNTDQKVKEEKHSSAIASTSNLSFKEKLENMKHENITTSEDNEPPSNIDEPIVRAHNKLEFLKPENIKDKKGRRPDHPDYDPRTLYVPEKFLATLSPGIRQWWVLKMDYFDCVLFFKVGKFYELYHMDADVGVNELGFTYMRGDFAHSGFPEISYDKMATTLIERGYKVARTEQTETPDMMTERCKKQKSVTKFDKVVKREICQITNRGTQVFGGQCQVTLKHQPNYMLAIAEKDEGSSSTYGICFIDSSIGDFFVGQFVDDKNCSRLLTLLSHNPPALVLYEKSGSSLRTQKIFKSLLSNTLKEALANETQFWGAEKTLKTLATKYFNLEKKVEWPKVIKLFQDEGDHLGLTPNDDYKLGLKALGACIWYLTRCLLDQQVLAMARYNMYTPPDILNDSKTLVDLTEEVKSQTNKIQRNRHMVLDSITLSNLRITSEEHSLLSTLDHCCTKFGKRLLHYWICSPSCDANIIRARQNAISELISNEEVLQEIRALFNTLPDFERHLAQIHGFGNGARLKNHPDGRAILFEEKTYNGKKIQNFISILRGFETLINLPSKFSNFSSDLIKHLTQLEPIGIYPELTKLLDFFKNAFNHEEALKEGIIAPEKGVDQEYDAVEEEIASINDDLKEYLTKQEKYFGCRLTYFGNDKKRFQLEIPESNAQKATKEYFLEGQKKGSKPVRRYHTPQTKKFLKRMIDAESQRNSVLKDLARRIFEKFSNHYDIWKRCVDSIATLDVLTSLAEFAKIQPEICVPEIVEDAARPFVEMEDGYHPCMTTSDNYIPNGITLGGENEAPLALLTGPNMGGKSTLMRQVGLLAIMVQIGSHIPAKSCRMTLIDRIFTRLGAQDDILAGHSTFLVELNETSAILKHATVNSLVLLDELGRGTATYDGTAIAASVVNFLADLKCRTLFSTHYHNLVDYFQRDQRIVLGHMACMVENEDSDDPTQETVTFLYKYTSGACPKSYGFNAAKLAGMPHSIIKRAYELSKKVEAEALNRKIISKILSKSNTSQIRDLISKVAACRVK